MAIERLYRRPFLLAGLAGLAALSTAGASGVPVAGGQEVQEQSSTERDTSEQEPGDESPLVRWSPDAINARVAPGQTQVLNVTLRARDDLSSAPLWLSPALRPFVTIQINGSTSASSGTITPTPTASPTPTPTGTPTPTPTGTPAAGAQPGGVVIGTVSIQAGASARLSLVIRLPADATEEDEVRGVLAVLQQGLPVSKRLLVQLRTRRGEEKDDAGADEAGSRSAGGAMKGGGEAGDNTASGDTVDRPRGRAGDDAPSQGSAGSGEPPRGGVAGRSGSGDSSGGDDQKPGGRRQGR